MPDEEVRLGDLIDDFCPRCKFLLNHAIASMMDGKAVKVICKTCYTEHAYRHGEGGKKKPTAGMTLFEQVLSNAVPAAPAAPAPKVEEPAAPPPKKKTATPARYISRRTERAGKKP